MKKQGETANILAWELTRILIPFMTVTAWALPSVTYLDENGIEQSTDSYTELTSNSGSFGESGWYVVDGNVTFSSGNLHFENKDVHLILKNNAVLTITKQTAFNNLTIYSQSIGENMGRLIFNYDGSGNSEASIGNPALSTPGSFVLNGGRVDANSLVLLGTTTINHGSLVIVTENNTPFDFIVAGNFTIQGGDVSARTISLLGDGFINGGSVSSQSFSSLNGMNKGSVTISGGVVDVNGELSASPISLGWENVTDYIKVGSYSGSVSVAEGKSFKDDDGNVYSGTLDNTAIGGKTLRPNAPVVIVDNEVVLDGEYSELASIEIPNPVEVTSINFVRTLEPGVVSTIVMPFSLPEGTTVNAKFYRLVNVGPNGKGGWKASFDYIGAENLPQANTPYVFVLNENENKLQFDLNDGKAIVQTTDIAIVDDQSGNWYFTGTYKYKVWTGEDDEIGRAYAFAASDNVGGAAKGKFGKIASGAWANPMRAYLCKKDASLRPSMAKGTLPSSTNNVVKSSINDLPEIIDVEFIDSSENGEKTLFMGRMNTRTGEIKMLPNYDLKGRKLNGTPKTRGAYYGKMVLKK
jgi:hypothetical protein